MKAFKVTTIEYLTTIYRINADDEEHALDLINAGDGTVEETSTCFSDEDWKVEEVQE